MAQVIVNKLRSMVSAELKKSVLNDVICLD